MVYLLTSVFLQRSINKLSPSSYIIPFILCLYLSHLKNNEFPHTPLLSQLRVLTKKTNFFFPWICVLADCSWWSTINQLDVIMRSWRPSKMLRCTSAPSQGGVGMHGARLGKWQSSQHPNKWHFVGCSEGMALISPMVLDPTNLELSDPLQNTACDLRPRRKLHI